MNKLVILIILITLLLSIFVQAELNLEEDNVPDDLYTKLEGDNYRFDVTLIHDDDGEVKYTDSWQVETLKGTLLGIKILTHAHGYS